jgi:hypothetical protein
MPQDESNKMSASINRLEANVDGLKSNFHRPESRFDGLESKFDGLNSKFDRSDSDVKSSYASIAEYLRNFEAHSEERFKTVIDRLDKVEQNTRRMSEDLTQLRSLTSERFDVTAGQQRISDKGQYRIERNVTDLQRRVEILENDRRS